MSLGEGPSYILVSQRKYISFLCKLHCWKRQTPTKVSGSLIHDHLIWANVLQIGNLSPSQVMVWHPIVHSLTKVAVLPWCTYIWLGPINFTHVSIWKSPSIAVPSLVNPSKRLSQNASLTTQPPIHNLSINCHTRLATTHIKH